MLGVNLLSSVHLFAGLAEDELASLASSLVRRSFAAGVFIFHEGAPGETMHLMESGRVRAFVTGSNGQEITIDCYGPGEVFGEMSVFDGRPRSATAQALEQTTTAVLDRDVFWRFLDGHPRLAHNVISLLTTRLRHTNEFASSLVFLDLPGRLAAKLLHLAAWGSAPDGAEVEINMTQRELATWVAASRETVNRALSDFREQGLIRLTDQRITLIDRQRLRRLIQI